jgi:hypothetical protein
MTDGLLDLLHAAMILENEWQSPQETLDMQDSSQNHIRGATPVPRRKRRKRREKNRTQAQRKSREEWFVDVGYESSYLDSNGIDHGLFVPPPTHPHLYKIYQEYCILVQKRYYSIPTDVESLDAELQRVCDDMRHSIHELIQ